MNIFFSLLAGTGAYVLVQYSWYSPWAFGSQWTRLQSGDKPSEPIALPKLLPPGVRHILLPAFIVSFSLHVFAEILAQLSIDAFFSGVGILWFLTVARKHHSLKVALSERLRWLIEDGVLLASLLAVAGVVSLFR